MTVEGRVKVRLYLSTANRCMRDEADGMFALTTRAAEGVGVRMPNSYHCGELWVANWLSRINWCQILVRRWCRRAQQLRVSKELQWASIDLRLLQ